MKLNPHEVAAALHGLAAYQRRQQLDGHPVNPAIAALLARLETETINPTPVSHTRRKLNVRTARSTIDTRTIASQNSPAAETEIIGTGRAASILGWSHRRIQRRHDELGAVTINGRLAFDAATIHALAAAQQAPKEPA